MKKDVVLNEVENKGLFNIQKLDKKNNSLKVNGDTYKREELFMKREEISYEAKTNKRFIKLLTKICLDLKIENYEEEIKRFLYK